MTRFLMIPAFLLAEEAVAVTPESALIRYGIPGIMLVLIVVLWREDRNARIEAHKATSGQYVDLVQRLLETVQTNTAAMQGLRDGLTGKVSNCPFDGQEMRGIKSKLDAIDEYQHRLRHDVISMAAGKAMIERADRLEQIG